ncbi:MAG: hypothetical protein M3Y18_01765 [Candidatus Eremiobacteraeota bacterium]|nr:hypothetical protein [Candidatus Eremiobacteraeota bacterium]
MAIVAVCAQVAAPQFFAFHTAWYNLALVALGALVLRQMRARGNVLVAAGASLAIVAGLACGLLAPDPQIIVGAPGATVQVPDARGALHFPLAPERDGALRAALARGSSEREIGPGRALFASFEMWPVNRTVLFVEARDTLGNHVTVTQPTGAAFLSPVLLLQSHTTIAGMDVPFDSFAVPAKGLVVKAILFAPRQAAQMRAARNFRGKSAVLFAVSDETGRMLAHGLGLAPDGGSKVVGPLRLQAIEEMFPAVEFAAIPNLPVLCVGIAAFLAGLLGPLRSRSRSRM